MKAFIGRCKACKGCVKLEPVVETKKYQVGADFCGPRYATRYTYTLPNGARVIGEYARFYAVCLCGKHAEFRKVFGVKTEKKCSDKCMSAKGPNCECACGGENHGGAFCGGGVTAAA